MELAKLLEIDEAIIVHVEFANRRVEIAREDGLAAVHRLAQLDELLLVQIARVVDIKNVEDELRERGGGGGGAREARQRECGAHRPERRRART